MEVNSKKYWDGRFETDWESCEGPRQSRFFSQIAIQNLPPWLLPAIRREHLRLVDWGCAQGDGTSIWADFIGPEHVHGVDFSDSAINEAKIRYPEIEFSCHNWLKDGDVGLDQYDIVYSSNTLEHFHNPFGVLDKICRHATKSIILALPYREVDRISEHFFSFLPENMPISVCRDFQLVWSKVVDCKDLPRTLWDGEQIIAIYANKSWLQGLSLVLKDLFIVPDVMLEAVAIKAAVAERERQIASLNQAVGERERQIASLNQAVSERERQIASLNQALSESNAYNNSLKFSRSWRLSRPLRILGKLVGAVYNENARYSLLKAVYWRLPEIFRRRLNVWRYAYIAKRYSNNTFNRKQLDCPAISTQVASEDWISKSDSSGRVIVIPSAFEFDELVNQRPINAAKYFAGMGYYVIFVAWQWSREEAIKCGEVWPNVHQVALFDFIDSADRLRKRSDLSIFMITLPAPALVGLTSTLRQKGFAIVYDILDEWEEFFRSGQAPWYMKSTEDSLIMRADLVCAVSPALRDKFAHLRSDIQVIGNGYSPEVLGVAHRGVAGTLNDGQTIIGYFGHLTDAWFDWRLVFEIAQSRPDITIEIIGYGEPDWVKQHVTEISNITIIGKIQPKDLHRFVRRWTVGIIPFMDGKLAEAVDPIKIYEYLYFGLPTLVTGIRHLDAYPITFIAERGKVKESIGAVLSCNINSYAVDQFLKACTWQARFAALVEKVEERQTIRGLYAD